MFVFKSYKVACNIAYVEKPYSEGEFAKSCKTVHKICDCQVYSQPWQWWFEVVCVGDKHLAWHTVEQRISDINNAIEEQLYMALECSGWLLWHSRSATVGDICIVCVRRLCHWGKVAWHCAVEREDPWHRGESNYRFGQRKTTSFETDCNNDSMMSILYPKTMWTKALFEILNFIHAHALTFTMIFFSTDLSDGSQDTMWSPDCLLLLLLYFFYILAQWSFF